MKEVRTVILRLVLQIALRLFCAPSSGGPSLHWTQRKQPWSNAIQIQSSFL